MELPHCPSPPLFPFSPGEGRAFGKYLIPLPPLFWRGEGGMAAKLTHRQAHNKRDCTQEFAAITRFWVAACNQINKLLIT